MLGWGDVEAVGGKWRLLRKKHSPAPRPALVPGGLEEANQWTFGLTCVGELRQVIYCGAVKSPEGQIA